MSETRWADKCRISKSRDAGNNRVAAIPRVLLSASVCIGMAALSGCDSTSSETISDEGVKTGRFVDSPVANIAYRTSTRSGFTNANGEYFYHSGETVTFSIGGIDLPSAPARQLLTPLSLVGVESASDRTVLNISRLLISLDVDGDPENGITISDQAHEIAAAMTLNFSSAIFDAVAINLVGNSGSTNTSLVSSITAQRHLESQLSLLPSDIDGDGVADTEDAFPNDPSESADDDNDGVGNNADYAPLDPTIQTICQSNAAAAEKEAAGCNNLPPVAIAGDDQTVGPLVSVPLDASSSYDVDGLIVKYQWQIVLQPFNSTATVANSNSINAIFNGGDLEGDYILQLTVTDEFGATASDQKIISVDKNLPAALAIFVSANVLYATMVLIGRRKKTVSTS